ncbi:MAG: RbsD/FucU domain-containing protein [Terracidiphilus sp.]
MSESASSATGWVAQLEAILPLFGHRNWIVVADAAYPSQSRAGIETIVAGADQADVLRKVLNAIKTSKHIRANVYVDDELRFVPERDAPGVENYREELDVLLADFTPNRLPHEKIIARLDQSAQLFRVLIVKTDMTIPYTSVFFELDCGYWNAEAEQRLRETILQADAE